MMDVPMHRVFGALSLLASTVFALPVRAEDDAAPTEPTGKTVAYEYDGKDVRKPELAWFARAYAPPQASARGKPVPLIVFLHGTNKKLVKYRWMGGGIDPDLRFMFDDLIKRGVIEPVAVAAPTSIVKSQVLHSSWDYFDVDKFVELTAKALEGTVEIDTSRIIVAGHSGAGCSTEGGLAALAATKRRLLGVFSIDTCMRDWLAKRLAQIDKRTHVIVSYQTTSWTDRPFDEFRKTFARAVGKRPPESGVLRTIEELRASQAAHQATVALSFEKWLPKLLAPPNAGAKASADAH
jgi:hypothetical protein